MAKKKAKNIVDDLVREIETTKGVTVSDYQKNIYDFVAFGKGNAVINAKAGSGKTTTLIHSLSLIPNKLKVLFVAFNKHIVTELNDRIKSKDNIDIKTVHSLGLSMIKRNFIDTEIEINEYKYRTYIKKNISLLTDMESKKMKKSEYDEYIDNISLIVNMARLNLCQCEADIEKILDRYGINAIDDEVSVSLKVMVWGKENYSSIDYTDMIWIPVELGLKPIGYQYDWIFVDELQDISDVQRELILKCFKRGTRMLGCGDPSQCIYSFSGSSPEAFKRFESISNTITLPLSISYRCAKNIVRLANSIEPKLEFTDNASDGIVEYDSHISDIKNGDMVLCRNKFPLFKLYMMFLKLGKKSYIKGNDIGDSLIKMVDSCGKTELNSDLKEDGVFVRLYEKMFDDRNKLIVNRGLDLDDATFSEPIMREYDNIKALDVLSEGIRTASELKERISKVFSDDIDGICLSTIHKAKGLESNNVYIICKSLLPSKNAKLSWEIEQERNLEYVAYTRAKYKLSFVSEKEVSPAFASVDVGAAKTELSYIEKRVCKLTGKEPMSDVDNIEVSKLAVSKIEKLKDFDTPNVIIIDSNTVSDSIENSFFDMSLTKKKRKKSRRF